MAAGPLATRRFRDRGDPQPAPPGWADAASRLLPAALVVVLWLGVIPPSGGYFPRTWYPAALGTVLLFCVLCLTRGRAAPSGRAARRSLALFAGLVAWAFLSLAWAGSPGDAWETANELALYLVAAAVA